MFEREQQYDRYGFHKDICDKKYLLIYNFHQYIIFQFYLNYD
jgi:hypothetical protein